MYRHALPLLVACLLTSANLSATIIGRSNVAGMTQLTIDHVSWSFFLDPDTVEESPLVQEATGIYNEEIEGSVAKTHKPVRADKAVDPFSNSPDTLLGPSQFISFAAAPGLTVLYINRISEHVDSVAQCPDPAMAPPPAQHCTPGGSHFGGPSPFSFTNEPGGQSNATFDPTGVDNGITRLSDLTAPPDTPYQTVLGFEPNSPNETFSVANAFSATVTVSSLVPEPATMLLIGVSLFIVPLAMRRFKKAPRLNR
jgi:hypothetical protein